MENSLEIVEMSPQLKAATSKVNAVRERVMSKFGSKFEINEEVAEDNEEERLRYVPIVTEYMNERPLYYSLVTGKLWSAPDKEGSRRPDLTKKEIATSEEFVKYSEKIVSELELVELREEEKAAR